MSLTYSFNNIIYPIGRRKKSDELDDAGSEEDSLPTDAQKVDDENTEEEAIDGTIFKESFLLKQLLVFTMCNEFIY